MQTRVSIKIQESRENGNILAWIKVICQGNLSNCMVEEK